MALGICVVGRSMAEIRRGGARRTKGREESRPGWVLQPQYRDGASMHRDWQDTRGMVS